jgi:signal transduction histidine kinase
MSHELRTPINVVLGYAQLLKDGAFGETNFQQADAIETIASRSKNLLEMINSLLYATSLESNGAKLEISNMSLCDLLVELKTHFAAQSNDAIELVWDVPADLPSIETDGPKLMQILQNIIHNAIKFTEKGVVATSVRYLADVGEFEFEVADTGIGIPAEEAPHIFERFHQIDSSETRSFEGLGLGLYIVKEFTTLLGGTLTVESEPENGSIFTLTLSAKFTNSRE